MYFLCGLVFLMLAKIKNMLRGYSTPKPFGMSEAERCAAYDIEVVERWIEHLDVYSAGSAALLHKTILELGPGSDLGTGVCLLARGAARYHGLDANDLARDAPVEFYELLLEMLGHKDVICEPELLHEEMRSGYCTDGTRINYVVRNDFDIAASLDAESVDLVFSQAAFEHFDDVEGVIAQLTAVCRPGAILLAQIDLTTHSRWIREADPNNIYRYSDSIYGMLKFRGSPNRMRPYQYKTAFERFGWTNVTIQPTSTLDPITAPRVRLDRRFAEAINQMDYLSIVLCATKE